MEYTNILIFLVTILLIYLWLSDTSKKENFTCPERLVNHKGKLILMKNNKILKEFETMEQYLNYYRFMNTNYTQKGNSCGLLNSEIVAASNSNTTVSNNAYELNWTQGNQSQLYYDQNRNPGRKDLFEGFEDSVTGEDIQIVSEEDDTITNNGCYRHDMCNNSQFCTKDRLCVDKLFCYDHLSVDGKCPPIRPYFKFIKSVVKKFFLDDSCNSIEGGHLSYAIDEHLKHFFEKNSKIFASVMYMIKEKREEPKPEDTANFEERMNHILEENPKVLNNLLKYIEMSPDCREIIKLYDVPSKSKTGILSVASEESHIMSEVSSELEKKPTQNIVKLQKDALRKAEKERKERNLKKKREFERDLMTQGAKLINVTANIIKDTSSNIIVSPDKIDTKNKHIPLRNVILHNRGLRKKNPQGDRRFIPPDAPYIKYASSASSHIKNSEGARYLKNYILPKAGDVTLNLDKPTLLGNRVRNYLFSNTRTKENLEHLKKIMGPEIEEENVKSYTRSNNKVYQNVENKIKEQKIYKRKQPLIPVRKERVHMEPDSSKVMSAYGYSYMPPTTWSVPQKRPPVCIPNKKGEPIPQMTKGVPLDALEYTKVGSILPKFNYEEKYNPDYYYAGWKVVKPDTYPNFGSKYWSGNKLKKV